MRVNSRISSLLFCLLVCLLSSCNKEDIVKDDNLLKVLLANQWVGSQDEFNEYESGNIEYREDRYRFLFLKMDGDIVSGLTNLLI